MLHFLAAPVQETPDELRVWESKSKALDLSQDHFDGNFSVTNVFEDISV